MNTSEVVVQKNGIAVGLYGAGGFAREIMPLLKSSASVFVPPAAVAVDKLFFMETTPTEKQANGYPIISEDDFFGIDCHDKLFNVAIASSVAREEIAERCIKRGAKPLSILAASAIVYDNNEIGEGAIICANCMITSNVKVGKFFHLNIYSYVAHDCVIGDYVTFAPNVHCNGNVHIHDHAYIGTGAVIKQGSSAKPLVIGEGAVIGMGAVVTKDVPPHTTVVGNPARVFGK